MTAPELVTALLLAGSLVGALWLAQSPGLAGGVVVVVVGAALLWLGWTAWLRWRMLRLRELTRQRMLASGTGLSSLDDGPGVTDGEEQFRAHVARARAQWERTGRV